MVLVEPPAPAALVLVGRALAIFSFWSAAARRRMAVRGPPGGVGDEGRPRDEPVAAPAGDEGRGDDCWIIALAIASLSLSLSISPHLSPQYADAPAPEMGLRWPRDKTIRARGPPPLSGQLTIMAGCV